MSKRLMLSRSVSLILLVMVVAVAGRADRLPAQTTTAPPADSAKTRSTAAPSAEVWDRLIYVPYRNIKQVFEKQGATVFMPYLEYLKLWQKNGFRKTPVKLPVSAVITRSEYIGRIDKDLARIEATYTVKVIGKPWAEVPVRFGEAAVGKVTTVSLTKQPTQPLAGSKQPAKSGGTRKPVKSDDSQVLLRGTGNGSYSLLFPARGTYTVRIELVTRVRTSPDGHRFQLRVPTVGITTFDLTVPEANQTVTITPLLISQPIKSSLKQTRIKATLGSTGTITAAWHPRTGTKPAMALLASVSNLLRVSIDEGLIHADARLDYQVLRGEMKELRIAIPKGHRILDISTTGVRLAGWKSSEEKNRQVVTARLLTPAKGKFTLEVHTEAAAPTKAFDAAGVGPDGTVSGIHSLDAVRESGQLVVTHGNALTLSVEKQRGLTRIDEADVPASARRSGAIYYRFYSPKFTLRIAPRAVQPRLVVDQVVRLVLRDDELQLSSEITYSVDRAGLFDVQLRLPKDMHIDRVTVDGLKEQHFDKSSGLLTISLTRKRLGTFRVTLTAHRPFHPDQSTAKQELPLPAPVGAERDRGKIFLYAPSAFDVVIDEGELVGAYPEPAANAPSVSKARLIAAWTYNRRPVVIPVRTVRRPTRLTAKIGTRIDVQQELVSVRTMLRYRVEYAGIDTFRFAVPEAVADTVQIVSTAGTSAPAIKQKSRAPKAKDGWVTWTVVMQQDILGEQPFQISYDLKPKADKPGSFQVTVDPIRVLGIDAGTLRNKKIAVALSRVAGEVAVVKGRALSVSAEADGGDIEPIDVRELTQIGRETDLAYRYFKQPVRVKLSSTKYEVQEVVRTVISKALVEFVITRDRMTTVRCRYRITSSERQRLSIAVPEGIEPLGVFVDKTPVSLEKNEAAAPEEGWGLYYINVARSKRSDRPFYLTLLFRMPIAAPGEHAFERPLGKLQLRLPQIGGRKANGVAVQQLRAVVWIPSKYSLVGTPENFIRESVIRWAGVLSGASGGTTQTGDLESWIGGETSGLFEFPSQGHAFRYRNLGGTDSLTVIWWRMALPMWVFGGALFLIALVLRNGSWENKLFILLLAGFLAALFAQQDSDSVYHGLIAARFGFASMLAVWLIHALFGRRRAPLPTAGSSSAGPSGPTIAAVIPPPGVFESLLEPQDRNQNRQR